MPWDDEGDWYPRRVPDWTLVTLMAIWAATVLFLLGLVWSWFL